MNPRFIDDIRKAVLSGKLKQPFRASDVKRHVPVGLTKLIQIIYLNIEREILEDTQNISYNYLRAQLDIQTLLSTQVWSRLFILRARTELHNRWFLPILKNGRLFENSIECLQMKRCRCHNNSVELYWTDPNKYTIITGYVDTTFLAAHHSWILENYKDIIIETNGAEFIRNTYYGMPLLDKNIINEFFFTVPIRDENISRIITESFRGRV